MALLINNRCINCDMCEPECPNDAITMGVKIYEIDPAKCTECVGHYDQPTCVAVCPIDCVKPNPNIQETEKALYEKFVEMHFEL